MDRRLLFSMAAILMVILVAGALLTVGEYYVRFSGRFANYYELNDEDWDPERSKEVLAEPWLWLNPKNGTQVVEKKEYRQVFNFGSEGLPGEAPPIEKEKFEYRVIVVGDSFVQGFGDTDGLGVVGRLKVEKPVRLMNAGIGGSDPVFELEFISRVLLKYKPDHIVLMINYSDVQDLKRRGGLDRFTPSGKLKETTPWWAWLFYRSHLFRAFALGVLRYDMNLTPVSESSSRESGAKEGIIDAVLEINKLAERNAFKLLVLMHPLQTELESDRLSSQLIDVKKDLLRKGIDVVDLTYQFRKRIAIHEERNYFWEKDGHYNPKGYAVFALAVEFELRQRLPKSRANK